MGQTVSLDQYVSSTPGCLPHTKGQEPTSIQFTGGTHFVDHCTKFMFIYHQVSLGAGETLVTKQTFESILKSFGFAVPNYHGYNGIFKMQTFMDGDNGVFKTQAFMDNCNKK